MAMGQQQRGGGGEQQQTSYASLFKEKDTFWMMVHGIRHAKKNHE
jgi:hypothetical protein